MVLTELDNDLRKVCRKLGQNQKYLSRISYPYFIYTMNPESNIFSSINICIDDEIVFEIVYEIWLWMLLNRKFITLLFCRLL